jgi:hypothetical protein
MPQPQKLQLPVHPFIASLTAGGQVPVGAVRFAGYVGDSGRAGTVRLYLTLNDLSQYLVCFETVGRHEREEDLARAENAHACDPDGLGKLAYFWNPGQD